MSNPNDTRPEMVSALRKQAFAPDIDPVFQFMETLDSFNPVLPDSVTNYYLNRSGVDAVDPNISKLISVCTQKFVSDILLDCMAQTKHRGLGVTKKGIKEVKYALTMDVLEDVLKEYGVEPLPKVPTITQTGGGK
uniref:Transcription initiation factor TFIID subunit 10 n=1 Tax=Rhabditophanes sp. KR3021 TaxID=114890 RepID=A0AC35TGJ9_9BILA